MEITGLRWGWLVILEGMIHRSLIIIHDGSYMKEISPSICAAATMIYCNATKKRCKCTWAEYSESAGSYRGEILGGIMTQLILKAAAKGYKGMIPRVGADMGILLTSHYQQTKHRLTFYKSSKT